MYAVYRNYLDYCRVDRLRDAVPCELYYAAMLCVRIGKMSYVLCCLADGQIIKLGEGTVK